MNFQETLNAALKDFAEHGYDSAERLAFWQERLRKAAQESMLSADALREALIRTYRAIYQREVDREGLLKFHRGVGRFTLERVKPQLRAELDRRILASADLIKLNREQAVQKTLQRFSGWATSIPVGGTDVPGQTRDARDGVRKALKSLPFEERRVLTDQGHKLVSNLSSTLALGGGALGGIWESHWREANYNYRVDHKKRDGKFYTVRGNWAIEKGLMHVGPAGYTDSITEPAEEPFCRCKYRWIYNLRSVPKELLTKKGIEELEKVRVS